MSSALAELRNIQFKPFIKLTEMEQNKEFKINGGKKLQTKYGERVVLELENNQIFLPVRYNVLSDKALEEIKVKGDFFIVNLGPVGKTFNLEFIRNESPFTFSFYHCQEEEEC